MGFMIANGQAIGRRVMGLSVGISGGKVRMDRTQDGVRGRFQGLDPRGV